jgi:hypothetical protein
MKVYGQLEKAQFENVAVDPSPGYPGRAIWNTATKQAKIDDGVKMLSLGGGGGGASLVWNTDNGTPFEVDNGALAFIFSVPAEGPQVNKAFFKVPESYNAGSQIKLYIHRYSADVTNTVLINANTYLVRTGTDPMDDTTNVEASGNVATALPGTAKVPQKIVLPLTSATGTINGVAVAAGDLLRIEMGRGTDTSTADCKVLTSTEVTIS